MSSRRTLALAYCLCVPFTACSGIGQTTDSSFSHVTAETQLKEGIELHDGPMVLRITALRPDILRLRAGRDDRLPEDASWAVLPHARAATSPVTPDSSPIAIGFHTAALRVSVARATGLLTISDITGQVLRQDTAPLAFDSGGFHIAQHMAPDEHFFGLGDKTGAFDRREQAFRMWNTDAYAWQESTDPLYKDIPFFLSYRAGTTLGVLIDDTWPSSFDFGKSLGDTFQYHAEGGAPDLYLLYGPSAKQVLAGYAWLTGPTPLPPLWALGFQQSRYSYMSQARVLEVAARFRADHIPVDAIYLDIDYQQKNRPFTIDSAAFPDFAGMVKALHDEHLHVVAITDLHIANLPNAGYSPYDGGAAGDHFVKNPNGSTYMGPVWPGASSLPRLHPAIHPPLVGLALQEFHRHRNRRLLERHERTLGVHPAEDHPKRGRPSNRRTRLSLAHRDPQRDPQCIRHGKHRGYGRRSPCPAAEGAPLCPHARVVRRRSALRSYLDRRQLRHLEPSAPHDSDAQESRSQRLLAWRVPMSEVTPGHPPRNCSRSGWR